MTTPEVHETIRSSVPLAGYTSIGLGGPAKNFAVCRSFHEMREALTFAREQHMPVHVLGGGTNVIFSDDGFPGLVVQVALRGISVFEGSPFTVTAAAGELWDDFVKFCIDYNLSGIECLSGIPGLVGGTPIQNVGAYGQEVSQRIIRVTTLDRKTFEPVEFEGVNCWFGYRKSRFKAEDAGRYIITGVTFGLPHNETPVIRYPELQSAIDRTGSALKPGPESLLLIREAVLGLRKMKSMLIDPLDPHARSVGSFFVNPMLTKEQFSALQTRWAGTGQPGGVPSFAAPEGIKVPAAWLVEHAGFPRGYRKNGVGVSPHHALALVNYGGTAAELLALADEIRLAVERSFGVRLQPEPVIVPATAAV